MAIKPIEWPAWSDWRQVLMRTWKEAGDDNVGLLAAGVAFYGFLAFVPLLASIVLTYGLIADPATVAAHIETLASTLPKEAAAIIADQLKAITGEDSAAHGLGLLVAIAIAIYGASKGAAAVVTALNVAYEVEETRGFIAKTALSLAMTVGMIAVVLAAALAISGFAFIEHLLPFSSSVVHTALQILFLVLAACVIGLCLALIYRYAPNRPDAPWAWITPGSAAATILWLIASLGFGLYVSNFGNYNATYGSLGGVVVFLTWLYLTAYIILMGGELNSELERQQAGTPAPGAEAPAQAAAAPVTPVRPAPAMAPEPPLLPERRRPSLAAMVAVGAGAAAVAARLTGPRRRSGTFFRYRAP
jgi:membrane protein